MKKFTMIDRGEETNEYGETRPVIEIREGSDHHGVEWMLIVSAHNIDQAMDKWHEANGMGTVEPYLCPEPIWIYKTKQLPKRHIRTAHQNPVHSQQAGSETLCGDLPTARDVLHDEGAMPWVFRSAVTKEGVDATPCEDCMAILVASTSTQKGITR